MQDAKSSDQTVAGASASTRPPDPPRRVTGSVLWRILAAKPVSIPLIVCAVLAVGSIWTSAGDFLQWRRVRSLKAGGRQAEAEVTRFGDERLKGERGTSLRYVYFEFAPAGTVGLKRIEGKRLLSLFVEPPKPGDELTVVYDPANPEDFVCLQTDDRPLGQRLTAQIFFLAVAGLVFLTAGLRFLKLLKIVGNAAARSGTVADIRSCAQGAFSRLLVVALQDGERQVIIRRVVPFRLAHALDVGDGVWLLVPLGKLKEAIIADAFL